MPNAGQVNNPAGANGATQAGGGESPYGTVKRLQQQTRMAPLPSAPGSTAPRRAKRAAAKGAAAEAPLPTAEQVAMSQPDVPYQVMVAQAWAAVAATPGASPLVQQMAQEAQVG